jgi:hypothetical protein
MLQGVSRARLSSMRLLFLAFAISFCALLWVAFSVARHIRRHGQPGAGSTDALIDGAKLPGREPDGVVAPSESRRPWPHS